MESCRFCKEKVPKTGLQNHEAQCYLGITCEGCYVRLHRHEIYDHRMKCQSMKSCRFCKARVPKSRLENHEAQCTFGITCKVCYGRFRQDDLHEHQRSCPLNQHWQQQRSGEGQHSQHYGYEEQHKQRGRSEQGRKPYRGGKNGAESEQHDDKRKQWNHGSHQSTEGHNFYPNSRCQSQEAAATINQIKARLACLEQAERKKALRALQLRYHPDKNVGQEQEQSSIEVFRFVQSLWDAEFR
eukprot:gnl/TRDRNA2_/TRDRNA2_126085_c0_seq2.p1 gnl/TRDRNA2_/TRDRNA2_126085_c0~~gnl/TRDRNA2_/TRDRNA2_126085_c0_seq2.p1  ORF type:complete len:241 (+),score=34.99 gnl/TRDRNA2_/TRDRNA2_126085_c0_seq2:107-829(+)